MAVPEKRREWIFDPFEEMRRMRLEMDEMFDKFFEMRWKPWAGELRAPLMDLEDRGDALVLAAELPGMEKEDINIEVTPRSISVSAEKKGAVEEKKKDYYYYERAYSGYKRSLTLPVEINPDEVEAEYKHGILTVTMKKVKPTPPKEEKKKIKVK